jgi:hypothetical protein
MFAYLLLILPVPARTPPITAALAVSGTSSLEQYTR